MSDPGATEADPTSAPFAVTPLEPAALDTALDFGG